MGVEENIEMDWIQVSRFAADTVVETWAQMDTPKMMVQLGMMPPTGGM